MGAGATGAECVAAACDPDVPLADVVEMAYRGPLADAGLSVREGQVAMGRAVADAIEGGTRLAVEAACGQGKGLGYLVPGVLAVVRANAVEPGSRHRVVVSTAAIQLQRQLVGHDVPTLAGALGIEVSAAVLKGRSNYACLQAIQDELAVISSERPAIEAVQRWLDAGGSGDRDDLPFQLDGRVWGRASVSSDACLGRDCPHVRACYAEHARNHANTVGVLVMNHWYLALAGAKLATDRSLVLIVDEAHDLGDSLRSAGGSALRESTARHWARVLDAHAPGPVSGAVGSALAGLVAEAGDLRARSGAHQARLRDGWSDSDAPDVLRTGVAALTAAAAGQVDPLDSVRVGRQAVALERLAERVEHALTPGVQACAWVESGLNGRPEVRVAPVRPVVTGPWRSVVACSATLGASPAAALRDCLPGPLQELTVPSPWPVERMAVAIVPDGPDPGDRGRWEAWVDDVASTFCDDLGGGVLVLATSLARARALASRLRRDLHVPVRCQGDAGRSELVEQFAAERDSVLVGSRSLFQGVDVPGDALRGVLIDRVPFPSPGDPMEEAIGELLTAAGRDPFRDRSVLRACAMLRQAAGRLLRSATDRGAVLLTDPRALRASWGAAVRAALAPMPLSTDVRDAGRMWRGEALVGVAPPAPAARRVRR